MRRVQGALCQTQVNCGTVLLLVAGNRPVTVRLTAELYEPSREGPRLSLQDVMERVVRVVHDGYPSQSRRCLALSPYRASPPNQSWGNTGGSTDKALMILIEAVPSSTDWNAPI